MNPHNEIELKYDGSKVSTDEFNRRLPEFLETLYPGIGKFFYGRSAAVGFERLEKGIDSFYRVGGKVVRYRRLVRGFTSELTIKARHSDSSLLSREEVDLGLNASTETVEAFMELLGGEYLFTLRKDYDLWEIDVPHDLTLPPRGWQQQDYTYPTQKFSLDIVRYVAYPVGRHDSECRQAGKEVTFIEVEIGKNSDVNVDEAMAIVGDVGHKLSKFFGLGKPINVSLFETFESRGTK